MALHTAPGFAFPALAVLSVRPQQGLMKILTDDTGAGPVLRRLLPVTFAVPLHYGGDDGR